MVGNKSNANEVRLYANELAPQQLFHDGIEPRLVGPSHATHETSYSGVVTVYNVTVIKQA
jgi:hypothetical protein